MELPVVEVRFRSFAALRRACEEHLPKMVLPLGARVPLPLPASLLVRFVCPDGREFELEGEATSAGGRLVARLRDGSRWEAQKLVIYAALFPSEGGPPQAGDPTFRFEPSVPTARIAARTSLEASELDELKRRLFALSVDERREAAATGDAAVRAVLLHDESGRVQRALLQNPALTLEEVRELCRLPRAAPTALRAVAQHPTYSRDDEVVRRILKHPSTPLQEAAALLERLPPAALRALALSPSIPEDVRARARLRLGARG